MANIEQELYNFKNAKYGEEVRDSMVSAIRKINEDASKAVETARDNIKDNLLPYPYYSPEVRENNGIKFTRNADGSVTAFGVATDIARYYFAERQYKPLDIKSGKEYTLSGCPSGGSSNTYRLYITHTEGNASVTDGSDSGNGYTFTAGDKEYGCFIWIAEGFVCNSITFYPMLNDGNLPAPYQPSYINRYNMASRIEDIAGNPKEIINVAESYYRNRDKLVYSQNKTAVDPGYVPGTGNIDCSTFILLCLMGTHYEESPYAGYPLSEGKYRWSFNFPAHLIRNAAEICKILVDAGRSLNWKIISNPTMEDFDKIGLKSGDIIFYARKNEGGSWIQPDRYLHVSHAAIVRTAIDEEKYTLLECTTTSTVIPNFSLLNRNQDIVAICRPDLSENAAGRYISAIEGSVDNDLRKEVEEMKEEHEEIHDIPNSEALKAMIDLIFGSEVVDPSGNVITYDQIVELINDYLKNNRRADGALDKQIPIAQADGTWKWGNITDYKGNILQIGGNLTLDDTPLYTTEKSIDYAVNSVANFLLNKIKAGGYTLRTANATTLGGVKANLATQEDTQEVHITADGFLKIKPVNGSGGTGSYYVEDYGITTDSADNASNLQNLINNVRDAGGGTIVFGSGDYKISHIDLKIGVNLQGQGYTATRLIHVPKNKTTDRAMIRIPKYSAFNSITNLELLGTTADWLYKNPIFWATKTDGVIFGPNEYIGIQVDKSINRIDGNGNLIEQVGIDYDFNKYVASENKSNVLPIELETVDGNNISYKWLNVQNVYISGFTGIGIVVYNSYAVFIDVMHCERNGCGAIILGTDHFVRNAYIEGNAWEGCIISCGNSQVSNLKVIWNGNSCHKDVNNTLVSPYLSEDNLNPYKTDVGENTTACVVYGSRMKVNQIEAQDNAYNGICIGGQYTMADTILSDGNGFTLGQGVRTDGAIGIVVKGKQVQMSKLAVTQYSRATSLKYGIIIDYAPGSRIEYIVQNTGNVPALNAELIGSNNAGAVINGIAHS